MFAISTKLELINLALDALGQSQLSQDDLDDAEAGGTDNDNATVCLSQYDPVRLGLLRQYPFEFCVTTEPLEQVDPDGLVIENAGTAAVNGMFSYASDVFTHSGGAVKVQEVSGVWKITNAAGAVIYYQAEAAADNPWSVPRWTAGAGGAAPLPKVYPGTPRDYAFMYKRPADCVKPLGIWNSASRKPDDRVRFKPHRSSYILCDQDEAVLTYVFNNETISEFDELFVQVFALGLALAAQPKVAGSTVKRSALLAEFDRLLLHAKRADAEEQHEDLSALIGRRYVDL